MTLVAPSILSANFAYLARDVKKVEEAGADWLHVDVMDGHFVPNLTVGPAVVGALRKETGLFLDVHLMIEKPENLIPEFHRAGANLITIHTECCTHLHRVVRMIKDLGIKAGVAVNPATQLDCLEFVLPYVDLALIMSVNPGFGGQEFIPQAVEKIARLKKMISSTGLKVLIQVDGGINAETGRLCIEAGADVLVAGSYVFKSGDVGEAIRSLK